MAVNVHNLTSGPAEIQLDDVQTSHTQGGVVANVSPQSRARVVDQYGSTPMDMIHTGDDVTVSVPMAEWTAAVLGEIYEPGNDAVSSSGNPFIGIGRSGGYIYTAKDLKIIPFLTADRDKKCQFFRTTPVGEFSITHGNDDDRVFEVDFQCMGDPQNQNDGNIVGRLFVSA